MESAGYGTSALEPTMRINRPATAPASFDDIDAIFQKLNSAIATSNQLFESAMTPTPDGMPSDAVPARQPIPQRAASVSMAGALFGKSEPPDWAAYEKKLQVPFPERPPSTSIAENNHLAAAPTPLANDVVVGHSSASVPIDLLDELAAMSLCEDLTSGTSASVGQRLNLRSPSPFPNVPSAASFASPPSGSFSASSASGLPPRPASASIWGGSGITPPRTPELVVEPEPVLAPAPQPAPQPHQPKAGRGKGGRHQHQLSPTQTRRADGERSPPAEARNAVFHGASMQLQPPVMQPVALGQPPQMMMPQLLAHAPGQQAQQHTAYPGVPTSLPLATMVNINGVPQLVALVPQQYAMPGGQSLMAHQPQQQPGLLSPQQQLLQLHALAQQQNFSMPYHGASLPVMPSGWSDGSGMASAMTGVVQTAQPPAGAVHVGWQGSGGIGGGGARGSGKHDGSCNNTGAEPRHSKRVTFRGRETRTVDEAAEAGALRHLAHEQHGCRFLQDQLDLRHKPHIDLIFEATKADAVTLAMDPFGNYLVQKLVQYGTTEQRGELVELTAAQMAEVALNVHGTRVIQKMVECADSYEQKSTIATAIMPRLMELIRDMNANHVVQRCLAALPSDLAAGIYDQVTLDCLSIASHRHGCCVLQRCLDHADAPNRDRIIAEVVRNAAELVVDPFGNYVVQYILDLKQPALTTAIVNALRGGFAELSLQKFSSNVIEKCLKSSDQVTVRLVAEELTSAETFPSLLHDPFANYVIQTLLTVGHDDLVGMIVAKIQPHLQTLRSTLYGKRIQAKLLKRCPNSKAGR